MSEILIIVGAIASLFIGSFSNTSGYLLSGMLSIRDLTIQQILILVCGVVGITLIGFLFLFHKIIITLVSSPITHKLLDYQPFKRKK